MEQVCLNVIPVEIKSSTVKVLEMVQITPETHNRNVKYRLAATVAKRLNKLASPVFGVGDLLFAIGNVPEEVEEELDIEGTNVRFKVKLTPTDRLEFASLSQAPERLVNNLIDWYCRERVPNGFHIGNCNYVGENLFAKHQSRLYNNYKININEGVTRTTRKLAGSHYILIDTDYRVTWEQTLWDSIKHYAKINLNRDIYMPDNSTVTAINQKFGRVGRKSGIRVQGKNDVGQYEVIEFDFEKTPETSGTIEKVDPHNPGNVQRMSQLEYFQKAYGNTTFITDKKQPLVKVKVIGGFHHGKINYHVPELLVFGGIPAHIRENPRVLSAIYNITRPLPRARYGHLLSIVRGDPFGKTKGLAADPFVQQFVNIAKDPVTVEANVLPSIKIRMGDSNFSVTSDSGFLKNIFKKKFHRSPEIKNVILVYSRKREEDITSFYKKLVEESRTHGLDLPENPERIVLEKGSYEECVSALENNHKADLILSFTSKEDEELYDAIKQELLVKYGVLSQNVTYENTIDRMEEYEVQHNDVGIKTILTFLAMQICAKMGGAPWAFSDPIYEEKCPIMGLDIFHETENGSAVGACAMFDPYGEYLYSGTTMPDASKKIDELRNLIINSLKRYEKQFGKPDKVMIIRDGLNFTQEQKFLHTRDIGEIAIIRNALNVCGIDDYILVMEKKNNQLRMYKKVTEYKVENPTPGTVIIGSPFESNEMLMVSHETYQGTVDPVLYKVLYPQSPHMDSIATAINKLARHHWNTNRSIKIPAPALHADMITYLVDKILGENPTSLNVLDKPFYL